MTIESSSVVFNPQVLARTVSAGFANVPILFGSGAVAMDTAMPYGNEYLGTTITVPYFTLPNSWSVVSDGSALTPVTTGIGNAAGNSTTPETATVKRAGIVIDFTTWAKANPLDPYGEARRMMLLGWAQAMEDELVTQAADNTAGVWNSYINDISTAADPYLSHDAIVDGANKLGPEAWRDPFVLAMVHSHTLGTMWKRKDSTGKPWVVEMPGTKMPDGRPIYMIVPLGIPVYVSDRLAPSGGVYTSIFCRRNSLALWVNPNLSARSVQVPTTDSQQDALNTYFACHRYKRLPNYQKPGVVLVTHQ